MLLLVIINYNKIVMENGNYENDFIITIYIKTKFNQAHLIKDVTKDVTVSKLTVSCTLIC